MTKAVFILSVPLVVVLIFSNIVSSEPPVQNSGGWGQQQQQQSSGGYVQSNSNQASGGYSSSYGPPAIPYSAPAAPQSSGGWGQQQQPQPLSNNGGGWGQQQQPQVQSSSGGWGQDQQSQKQQSSGGWGSSGGGQSQMKGGSGWGPQLNVELDTAHLKTENLNPIQLIRSIFRIPGKIINFIRESGLYLLFIPLIIIIPLMLLAFNVGRTFGALKHGWGWGRSLKAVESNIVGYLKSPVWKKIGQKLRDERVFERVMKSIEEYNKDW